MDSKKLIEQYRNAADYWRKNKPDFPDVASSYERAATALSTLQDENEKMRDELDRLRSEPGQELWSAENQRADRLAAELERVRKDNKRLCAAMMAVRRKESQEPMHVVYEMGYDAILSHEDIQDIARIVFDGLMREDLKRRGQKEDI